MNLQRLAPVAAGLLLAAVPASALPAAGHVLFALNRVEIVRGDQVLAAGRGTPVEVGDTLSAAANGFAQIRFADGALLSLKPGAQMQIEDFRFTARAPDAAADAAAPANRSVLRLLRGAFRTITGAIGKSAGDTYEMKTPVATLGIRGTDYSASFCSGDCGTLDDGLYAGVSDGEIVLTNDVGQLVLGDDEYAYIRDLLTPPVQLLGPPAALDPAVGAEPAAAIGEQATADFGDVQVSDSGPRQAASADSGGHSAAETLAPAEPPHVPEQVNPEGGTAPTGGSYAFGTGATGAGPTGAGGNGTFTNADGGLSGFALPAAGGAATFHGIGTSLNLNRGFNPGLGFHWGRWGTGTAQVNGQPVVLATDSLHWIYSAETGTPVLPVSGTARYELVGNTDPTDGLGAVGYLGSADLTANFTDQTVTSTLNIGIGGSLWQASGAGSIGEGGLFAGDYGSVVVDGIGGGTGRFAGFFSHQARGAGLGYSLGHGDSIVSGVAAFRRAAP